MVTAINNSSLTGFASDALAPADLYSRITKSLLSQNATVQKLSNGITADQTKLSGLGQLNSALADFEAFTQSVNGTGLQTAATAGTPTVLDALTKTGAKAGSYQVDVKQLAQAQQLTSQTQSSQTAAIGSGAATTIRIETGTTAGASFSPRAATTITIDASNNSLQGIAKALNAAGVDAAIVKNGNGYSLQVNGDSGSANTLRISVGGDASLQKLLAYNPAGGKGLTQSVAAQDAILVIDGKSVTSASNVVTGQIDGTALALKTKGATSVTVGQDNSAIAKNVANFATGFNSLATKLTALRKGDLKSDTAVGQVQDQLNSLIKNNAALAKAGVTLGADGLVHIDTKALDAAVAADPSATAKLFTNDGLGVADQIAAKIAPYLGSAGSLGKEAQTISKDAAKLATQQDSLTKALTAQASALVSKYAAASGDATTAPSSVTAGLPGGLTSTATNPALPGYSGPTSLFDILA